MAEALRFVVQEHHARSHHFDLRLEKDGVFKSWALPKGVPEAPGEKRLAIQVDDHALAFGDFEGTIPSGEYGAGTIRIWDRGDYTPLAWTDDAIEFSVNALRTTGDFVLRRFLKRGKDAWLLMRKSPP